MRGLYQPDPRVVRTMGQFHPLSVLSRRAWLVAAVFGTAGVIMSFSWFWAATATGAWIAALLVPSEETLALTKAAEVKALGEGAK